VADIICDDGTELASLAPPTRNRYFYGKLLDVLHFDLEQTYMNRKRWLLNRLAVGSGVLCGLSVTPSGDGSGVVVAPGVAIDPLGREIVVPVPSQKVDPHQPTDGCGKPFGDPVSETVVTVCLAYHECESEPVPAMVCDCDGQSGCQASSIRERYMLLVQAQAPPTIDVSCQIPDLYQVPKEGPGLKISYPALVDRVDAPCPDPSGSCVAVAQVTVPAEGEAITEAMIDMNPRPIVYSNELLFEMLSCLAEQSGGGGGGPPPKPPDLTHVSKISWPHDGTLSQSKFLAGLEVTFDRPVTIAPSTPRTWFLVSLEFPVALESSANSPFLRHSIAVVRVLEGQAGLDPSGLKASFVPDPQTSELLKSVSSPEKKPLVRVLVSCDFLLDEKGLAVDGDFLGGTLDSGDGVAGGTFESWFTLK
jgi:hypothetical protein